MKKDIHVSSIGIDTYMDFCKKMSPDCTFISRVDNDGTVIINTKRNDNIATSFLFKNLSDGGYFVQAKDEKTGTTWLGEAFENFVQKENITAPKDLDDLTM